MTRTVIFDTSDVVSINGLPENAARAPRAGNGLSESLQREVDALMRQYPLMTYCIDPQQEEIANLKGELESARYEAVHARKLAAIVKSERDAATYERDIALRALAEIVQHFINAPATVESESCPALDAIRATQINNRVR